MTNNQIFQETASSLLRLERLAHQSADRIDAAQLQQLQEEAAVLKERIETMIATVQVTTRTNISEVLGRLMQNCQNAHSARKFLEESVALPTNAVLLPVFIDVREKAISGLEEYGYDKNRPLMLQKAKGLSIVRDIIDAEPSGEFLSIQSLKYDYAERRTIDAVIGDFRNALKSMKYLLVSNGKRSKKENMVRIQRDQIPSEKTMSPEEDKPA